MATEPSAGAAAPRKAGVDQAGVTEPRAAGRAVRWGPASPPLHLGPAMALGSSQGETVGPREERRNSKNLLILGTSDESN